MTIQEAEKLLKENGLFLKINNETEEIDKTNGVVQNQIPQPGIVVFKENNVYVDV